MWEVFLRDRLSPMTHVEVFLWGGVTWDDSLPTPYVAIDIVI